jgi:hypothetical protein
MPLSESMGSRSVHVYPYCTTREAADRSYVVVSRHGNDPERGRWGMEPPQRNCGVFARTIDAYSDAATARPRLPTCGKASPAARPGQRTVSGHRAMTEHQATAVLAPLVASPRRICASPGSATTSRQPPMLPPKPTTSPAAPNHAARPTRGHDNPPS